MRALIFRNFLLYSNHEPSEGRNGLFIPLYKLNAASQAILNELFDHGTAWSDQP